MINGYFLKFNLSTFLNDLIE